MFSSLKLCNLSFYPPHNFKKYSRLPHPYPWNHSLPLSKLKALTSPQAFLSKCVALFLILTCFYFLDDDSKGCIASLLDTSVTHAPYFEWVVAHLGSCFPSIIINRILSLGLMVSLGFLMFLSITKIRFFSYIFSN